VRRRRGKCADVWRQTKLLLLSDADGMYVFVVVAGSGVVAIVAGLQNECAAQIRFGSAGGE